MADASYVLLVDASAMSSSVRDSVRELIEKTAKNGSVTMSVHELGHDVALYHFSGEKQLLATQMALWKELTTKVKQFPGFVLRVTDVVDLSTI